MPQILPVVDVYREVKKTSWSEVTGSLLEGELITQCSLSPLTCSGLSCEGERSQQLTVAVSFVHESDTCHSNIHEIWLYIVQRGINKIQEILLLITSPT